MSQITLEIDNSIDLELLLSLAKRLDIKVVSLQQHSKSINTADEKLQQLQAAATDPLFLADIDAVTDDFKHVDSEL